MEHQKEKGEHQRVPYPSSPFNFTVLSMQESEFQRIQSTGTIRDVSKDGIEIITEFALQPGQVLQWYDRHGHNRLHIALVNDLKSKAIFTELGCCFY